MHSNRLIHEQSPYLLQHAHNPVDWYPWGPEAFEKARQEDKPIFLSIGYSTCHWCHVMERESFENEPIAGLLNRYFVAIKVDREERPDVDRIYMAFVQATTGGGGWPMSVWLTPALEPFYGGTYFPPEQRYGHAGFPMVLERVAEAWRQDRDRIVESSRDAVAQLTKQSAVVPAAVGTALSADRDTLDRAFYNFRRSFDSRYAGFGDAPKFPRPVTLNFLLRYYARTRNQEALDMVLATLREMAKGGMYDQLGGGFHRYAVDARWFVPHFEKMLYDQAQLGASYLEAFQITHDAAYAETARGILDYVLRDMRDPDGGFYSAEDADSVIDPAHPEEKGEGAFYIWTQSQIEAIGGRPAADWFAYRYGAEADGNVRSDPHGEFTGRNIVYQAHSLEETVRHFDRPAGEVQAALDETSRKLLAARSSRVRPHLDDKVLTAWNGLMISALAKAGAVLGDMRYAEAARTAADFIARRMYDPTTGILLRRYRKGEAAIPGFLDDYAFFTQALLDLYELGFEWQNLELAFRLTEKQSELFEDPENGAFYSTAAGDAALVMRLKEDYDGAEPSGNSVAALNLLRLAQITDRRDWRESAMRTLQAFGSRMVAAPAGVPQMLVAYEFSLSKPRQIVIAGERGAPGTQSLLAALHAHFVPNRVVLLADAESRPALARYLPAVAEMRPIDGRAAAYVCEDYACKLPTSDVEVFGQLLQ
ncbi:MAG TPA: thioredoxin domain-containing protein [Bryobacteraceae bacterium]|nr:thioredoxin domain-containing protein [Bryobacteraceae bacterium]